MAINSALGLRVLKSLCCNTCFTTTKFSFLNILYALVLDLAEVCSHAKFRYLDNEGVLEYKLFVSFKISKTATKRKLALQIRE